MYNIKFHETKELNKFKIFIQILIQSMINLIVRSILINFKLSNHLSSFKIICIKIIHFSSNIF